VEHNNHEGGTTAIDVEEAADVERLLAVYDSSDYVEAVVELAEQSERNYLAAVSAGQVVNGATDSTNY
jgi:hypothetical protein